MGAVVTRDNKVRLLVFLVCILGGNFYTGSCGASDAISAQELILDQNSSLPAPLLQIVEDEDGNWRLLKKRGVPHPPSQWLDALKSIEEIQSPGVYGLVPRDAKAPIVTKGLSHGYQKNLSLDLIRIDFRNKSADLEQSNSSKIGYLNWAEERETIASTILVRTTVKWGVYQRVIGEISYPAVAVEQRFLSLERINVEGLASINSEIRRDNQSVTSLWEREIHSFLSSSKKNSYELVHPVRDKAGRVQRVFSNKELSEVVKKNKEKHRLGNNVAYDSEVAYMVSPSEYRVNRPTKHRDFTRSELLHLTPGKLQKEVSFKSLSGTELPLEINYGYLSQLADLSSKAGLFGKYGSLGKSSGQLLFEKHSFARPQEFNNYFGKKWKTYLKWGIENKTANRILLSGTRGGIVGGVMTESYISAQIDSTIAAGVGYGVFGVGTGAIQFFSKRYGDFLQRLKFPGGDMLAYVTTEVPFHLVPIMIFASLGVAGIELMSLDLYEATLWAVIASSGMQGFADAGLTRIRDVALSRYSDDEIKKAEIFLEAATAMLVISLVSNTGAIFVQLGTVTDNVAVFNMGMGIVSVMVPVGFSIWSYSHLKQFLLHRGNKGQPAQLKEFLSETLHSKCKNYLINDLYKGTEQHASPDFLF